MSRLPSLYVQVQGQTSIASQTIQISDATQDQKQSAHSGYTHTHCCLTHTHWPSSDHPRLSYLCHFHLLALARGEKRAFLHNYTCRGIAFFLPALLPGLLPSACYWQPWTDHLHVETAGSVFTLLFNLSPQFNC